MPHLPYSAPFSVGNAARDTHILIVHGYTGSPDEFKEAAATLAERFNAWVNVPLLPGHGTKEEDLLDVSLEDHVRSVRGHMLDSAKKAKHLCVIGHSMGGHFAALAAHDIDIQALVLTVMPFTLRPPFSIPGMDVYARTKTFWEKKLSDEDRAARSECFFYERMPGTALGDLKEANRLVAAAMPKLTMPILTINNREDPLSYAESGRDLLNLSKKNPRSKSIILEKTEHGVFYGEGREKVVTIIGDFLDKEIKNGR